jgi:stage II sporulation protein M
MGVKARFKRHLVENRWQYLIVVLLFLLGILLGGFKANQLDGAVKGHLSQLVDHFLQQGAEGSLNGPGLFLHAFLNQARTVLLVWFLGMTVIGLPLIMAVVFIRGFSLGFTIGFLFQDRAGAGILISLLSVVPQNLVYILFLFACSVMAMNFSLYLVRYRSTSAVPLGTALMTYSLVMFLCLLAVLGGALIEAYLCPWLLGLVLS